MVRSPLINSELLQPFCKEIRFAPGDVLRQKGQHYLDMYLLTDGSRRRSIGKRPARRRNSGSAVPGSPIGEIGFLHGCPAHATVTARTSAGALVIDDPTLARLEREQPALAADLLRCLAEIAEERTSYNLVIDVDPRRLSPGPAPSRSTCAATRTCSRARNGCDTRSIVEELGRQSPYADHDKKIITDDLDDSATRSSPSRAARR